MKTLFVGTRSPFLLVGSLALIGLLTSCDKTEDFQNMDLLAAKEWHLTSIQSDGVEVSDSCDLDDVLRFTDDQKFTASTGNLVCEEDGSQELDAQTWKLTDDFTVLRMKYRFRDGISRGSMTLYWEIITLNDSSLVIKDALAENNDQIPEYRYYE